jgi:hypothetical protein
MRIGIETVAKDGKKWTSTIAFEKAEQVSTKTGKKFYKLTGCTMFIFPDE